MLINANQHQSGFHIVPMPKCGLALMNVNIASGYIITPVRFKLLMYFIQLWINIYYCPALQKNILAAKHKLRSWMLFEQVPWDVHLPAETNHWCCTG